MADTKLITSADIPVPVGQPTEEQSKKWVAQQVPYKNYAGFSGDLDERIRQFVEGTKRKFLNRMSQVHERWAVNWSTANGEQLTAEHEDDVTMPETKKVLGSKTARIEEALFQFDPFFEVEGTRQDLGKLKAFVVGAYIRRLLEMGRYQDLVRPVAQDGELCNFQVVKVSWSHKFENVIERLTEMRFDPKTKDPYLHDERRMGKREVYNGPVYHQVDPFWLLIDLEAKTTQDCSYIGEQSEVFLHELEAMADMGIYPKEQIKKIRERRSPHDHEGRDSGYSADFADQYRNARSIAQPGPVGSGEHNQSEARRVRCVELWAWYDFGDGIDGVTDPLGAKLRGAQRVVVTVANGVVIRFQLNPYDRKFVPYAVARINRNGHEMVSPAPFDDVVIMNAQYDRFQSMTLRHMLLSILPLIAARGGSDVPDTISDLKAGTILRDFGEFDQINIKDLPQSVSYFQQFYRREMEELSGSLRIYESPQGTATETERKVQEQQRAVRASIRANADLWRQVALITYWMAAQFSTGVQRFQVVGKASKVLGKEFEITPMMLQEDIDIRFIGLDSLHTYDSRGTGMQMWTNQWGPQLQVMPEVNRVALAKKQWEHMVGKHDVQEIFNVEEPVWMAWPQEEENEMLRQGQKVPVSENDDDEDHIRKMGELLELAKRKGTPAYVADAIYEHWQSHIDQARRKLVEQKALQKQAEQRQQLMGPGGEPGLDRAPLPGGTEARTGGRVMTGMQGVTNGPDQGRTVSKGGRQGSGTSQAQMMSMR